MSEWISVETALPESGQWVLMYGEGYGGVDRYRAGFYIGSQKRFPDQHDVWLSAANLVPGDKFTTTHWRELPPPPEQDK